MVRICSGKKSFQLSLRGFIDASHFHLKLKQKHGILKLKFKSRHRILTTDFDGYRKTTETDEERTFQPVASVSFLSFADDELREKTAKKPVFIL